jgi:hypothetical protein
VRGIRPRAFFLKKQRFLVAALSVTVRLTVSYRAITIASDSSVRIHRQFGVHKKSSQAVRRIPMNHCNERLDRAPAVPGAAVSIDSWSRPGYMARPDQSLRGVLEATRCLAFSVSGI